MNSIHFIIVSLFFLLCSCDQKKVEVSTSLDGLLSTKTNNENIQEFNKVSAYFIKLISLLKVNDLQGAKQLLNSIENDLKVRFFIKEQKCLKEAELLYKYKQKSFKESNVFADALVDLQQDIVLLAHKKPYRDFLKKEYTKLYDIKLTEQTYIEDSLLFYYDILALENPILGQNVLLNLNYKFPENEIKNDYQYSIFGDLKKAQFYYLHNNDALCKKYLYPISNLQAVFLAAKIASSKYDKVNFLNKLIFLNKLVDMAPEKQQDLIRQALISDGWHDNSYINRPLLDFSTSLYHILELNKDE